MNSFTRFIHQSAWCSIVAMSLVSLVSLVGCGSEQSPPTVQNDVISESALSVIQGPQSLSVQDHLYPPNTYYHERFGSVMALENDTAIVNCWHSSIEGTGGYSRAYVRNGNIWTFQQQLEPPSPATHIFGNAVALSGDTAVVGAYQESASEQQEGAVYVFVRNGTTWSVQQRIANPHPTQYKLFGAQIALDQNTLVISGPPTQTQIPIVYVFVRNGTTWSLTQEITPPSGYSTTLFGSAIALSSTTLLIGSYGDDIGNNAGAGSIFEYAYDGTNWVVQNRIVAMPGGEYEFMGGALALSGDTFIAQAAGLTLNGVNTGGAYIFSRNGNSWSQDEKLVPSDGVAGQNFGFRVAIDGSNAVVGISSQPQLLQFPNYGNPNPGAYLYSRNGNSWSLRSKLLPDDNFSGNSLGHGVAISGSTLFVGAPEGEKPGQAMTGSVYIFELTPGMPNGTPCSNKNECESGFCTEGVCCDKSCGNGAMDDCQVCSAASGATADGTCTALPAFTLCRASVGTCDEEEMCDGTSPLCPIDSKKPASTLCRPAADICDQEEICDGENGQCPFDEKQAKNTPCRASAGICDKEDVCDGLNVACPVDEKMPNTFSCREALTECDVAEHCSGTSNDCPADDHEPDQTPCSSGICHNAICENDSNGSSSSGASSSGGNGINVNGDPSLACRCSLPGDEMETRSIGALFMLLNLVLISWRRRSGDGASSKLRLA